MYARKGRAQEKCFPLPLGVWKGLAQGMAAELLMAFETPKFLVFTFSLARMKKIEAKAEEFVCCYLFWKRIFSFSLPRLCS